MEARAGKVGLWHTLPQKPDVRGEKSFAIIVPRDRIFTPEKWARTPDHMRHKLMWSFHRQYQLEGMTRKEVEKLLGKGSDLQGSVEYKLKDDWIGGWRVYHIDYKQDRVIRAKETWQDW